LYLNDKFYSAPVIASEFLFLVGGFLCLWLGNNVSNLAILRKSDYSCVTTPWE